jgi:hypothetical protein
MLRNGRRMLEGESVAIGSYLASRTSELRELVSIPTPPFLSMTKVLVPSLPANCRAIANPTAPPPMTCTIRVSAKEASLCRWETCSMCKVSGLISC